MAARDQVKTLVPTARSTLDGHPEVKQRATMVFAASGYIRQSHKPHPFQLTTGLLGLVKFLPYNT